MYTPNRYIAIPRSRNLSEIQALCEGINKIRLTGPSIISSDKDCAILYGNNVMKIGGTIKEIQIQEAPYTLKINISSEDIKLLEHFIPNAPYVTPNFNKTSLDIMYNQLRQTKNARRIKSTAETELD